MTYSFETLSPADFEDLVRDLIGCELGVRFEAFGPGPDGGIDGRHATGDETVILQAKHYRLSDMAALARVMKKERDAIDRLEPDRYILATSRPLTPDNKAVLAEIVGPSLTSSDDIFGCEDLNGLVRKNPDIERSHVKLWLSGAGALDRVLNAASHNFTTITRQEIEAKLKVYAENPSFKSGRDILESQRVLIISGPPGVGKTTLAEMLCYAYIAEEWELIAIRNLEEGFARIDDSKRQVFFFDDFLGRIALDERALSTQDSDLARFIGRVRRTPSARFILTTRAYIYEQARLLSEALSDTKLNVSRYVLDVGIYTRRIRARILYNHLVVAGVPEAHIAALIEQKAIKKIVDHKHYNPRIIQFMTEADRIADTDPASYPKAFLDTLKDPDLIWDKAFRTHIARRSQHLLIALFLMTEYGSEIEDLEEVFAGIHSVLCTKFGVPYDPKDFEGALRTVEGSFVVISGTTVRFVNPSVRDYLARYLSDKALLSVLADGVPTLRSARNLFDHFMKRPDPTNEGVATFVSRFVWLCERFVTVEVWKRIPGETYRSRMYELSNSDRMDLLVNWWRLSNAEAFIAAAQTIADKGCAALSAWEDGRKLPEMLAGLRAAQALGEPTPPELIDAIQAGVSGLLATDLDPDDITRILAAADDHEGSLPPELFAEIEGATQRMIEELPDNLGHMDSESTLEDWGKTVEKLAARFHADPRIVERAHAALKQRTTQLRETEAEDTEASFTGAADTPSDKFDDAALASLFGSLGASTAAMSAVDEDDLGDFDDIPF
ncbi:restriction endonuclease [uncultured Sphingomonas sp.]|uniref:nSTAND3 domain-containing NTPase n=1 Tax=uncultured Sphingomonas sp. TaxID=158754 RepID=UPI0037481BCF